MKNWPERLELIVFDFDGVMTNNTVVVMQDGTEAVICNRSDGLGVKRLKAAGVALLVLSTERNAVVDARCRKLDIPCLYGIADKGCMLKEYLSARNIPAEFVAYVGNDINDADCLMQVGFPVVVADAHSDVRPLAKLVLRSPGGAGAVREFADRFYDQYKRQGKIADEHG